MKCPMLTMYAMTFRGPEEYQDRDCLKEECAWWDDGHPGCSILTIAQELATKRQKEEVEGAEIT